MTKTKAAQAQSPLLVEPLGGGWARPVKDGDIVTPKDPAKYGWRELRVLDTSKSLDRLWTKAPDGSHVTIAPDEAWLTTSSELQALAQLESIREMVAALKAKRDAEEKDDDELEAISSDPLSVEVRSGWVENGKIGGFGGPAEFKILLCTGGPAVQIIGELNAGEPEKPRLQHQDWGTPWTDVRLSAEDEETLLAYCREFYFGE